VRRQSALGKYIAIRPITDAQKTALGWLLESVVIDIIANKMASDDDYALVIGRRLRVSLTALEKQA
jgi:hypothetical protein